MPGARTAHVDVAIVSLLVRRNSLRQQRHRILLMICPPAKACSGSAMNASGVQLVRVQVAEIPSPAAEMRIPSSAWHNSQTGNAAAYRLTSDDRDSAAQINCW